uniref:Phospholipase A2 group III n=1 Tax=Strix occidentalis caurina TaxID=311401 RepID=A0A8D0F395_STROC
CADTRRAPASSRGSRTGTGLGLPRGAAPGGRRCVGRGCGDGVPAAEGLFRGPDRCCREHDRCSAQIGALQFSYGIRNYRLHTVSRCDCDARFRQCLLALNDTVSNIIGVTFFNLLEVPCFVLEESRECVQWHWWGGPRLGASAAAALSVPSTPVPAMEGRRQQGESVLGAERVPQLGCPKASACWGCVLGVPITFLLSSGPGRVCRCYKHLDKCEHGIAPHEVKYQLHNVDTRTLFHCNCTRRCCYPLLCCTMGWMAVHVTAAVCITATRAVLEPAQHLKKTLRRWDPLHVTSKARCPDWKAQDTGGTLYMQCLQLALEQKPGAWHHMVPQ